MPIKIAKRIYFLCQLALTTLLMFFTYAASKSIGLCVLTLTINAIQMGSLYGLYIYQKR